MELENEARHRGLRAVPRGGGLVPGRSCAIGISIGNARCEGEHLAAMLDLAAANYERTTLLIGDSLHRLTLRIERGVSPAFARDAALELGREIQQRIEASLPRQPRIISVLLTSQLSRLPSFDRTLQMLTDEVPANRELRDLLERDAAEYLARPARERSASERFGTSSLRLTCRYLLEDVALCATLAMDCGIHTLLYPGVAPRVLSAAMEGGVASLRGLLEHFRFVPVRFRGCGRESLADDAATAKRTGNESATENHEDRP
jgi:tRNA-dependent cyclodipeptide synthase